MLKYFSLFLIIIVSAIVLFSCKDVEEKTLESLSLSPSAKQTCSHYDTTADSSYSSGCDNDNQHFMQYILTGKYANDDTENLTNSALITWTVDDDNGASASILSDTIKGRAYLTTEGTFSIYAEYTETASNENEDDVTISTTAVLVVQ